MLPRSFGHATIADMHTRGMIQVGRLLLSSALGLGLLFMFASGVSANPCVGLRGAQRQACFLMQAELWQKRTSVLIYTVQPGDTLWSIAADFDLDVDTLRYSNPAVRRNPDVLSINQQLRILPFLGAIHVVAEAVTFGLAVEKTEIGHDDVAVIGVFFDRLGRVEELND